MATQSSRRVHVRKAPPHAAVRRLGGTQHAGELPRPLPLLPFGVEHLQHTAGNQAVRRLLTRERPAAGFPSVQRKTKPEYGLALPKSMNPYSKKATALWKSNQKMSLEDFATELIGVIKPELASMGVPPVKWTSDPTLGVDGLFDSEHWELKYNPVKFSQDGKAKELGDLHPEEARNAAGTLYHEARHADQDVLNIRVLLADKKTSKQIAAETKMPQTVIEAVEGRKFTSKPSADQVAHARRMIAVMYGEHNQVLKFIMDNEKSIEEFQNLVISSASDAASIKAALAAAKPHVTKFLAWSTNILTPRIGELLKLKPKAGTQAAAVRDGLIGINAAIAAFSPHWSMINANAKPTAAAFQGLKDLGAKVVEILVATYRGLEGEADAFEVEAAVKAKLAAGIPDEE